MIKQNCMLVLAYHTFLSSPSILLAFLCLVDAIVILTKNMNYVTQPYAFDKRFTKQIKL